MNNKKGSLTGLVLLIIIIFVGSVLFLNNMNNLKDEFGEFCEDNGYDEYLFTGYSSGYCRSINGYNEFVEVKVLKIDGEFYIKNE